MPGLLVHVGAVMQCTHGGKETTAPTQPRVLVSGKPVAITSSPMTVAGCVFTLPNGKPQPCVRVQWANVAGRVLVCGLPPLLQIAPGVGNGVCLSAEQIPQGPPFVGFIQARVTAT